MRLLTLLFTVSAFCTTENLKETVESKGSVSATSHFLMSQSRSTNDPSAPTTELYRHEAAVNGEYQPLSANVSFTSRYTPDARQDQNTAFTLEKKTATYDGESLNVKLGDSHQELGKGIALSLYRDANFGIDNTLEGGAVKLYLEATEAGAFGGRVNVWKVPIAINPVDQGMKNRNVYLAAAHLNTRVMEGTKVGSHYLLTQNENAITSQFTQRQQTVGATVSVENIVDEVDFYTESNLLTTEDHEASVRRPTGYGSYGFLSWSPSPVKIKAEIKDYRGFHYEFRRPPTLEEDIIPSSNYDDVTAIRLYGEYQLGDTRNSLSTSFLTGYDREVQTQIYHPLAGIRYQISPELNLDMRGGYRWMTGSNNLSHASLKTKLKTGKGQYFEFEYRKQIENRGLNSPIIVREDRNIFLANYTFNERLSGGIGYEYMPSNDADTTQHFVNFNGNYKNGNFNSRALVGQTSGGTQCSGGVCRQIPAFTGAYLEMMYAF